jgi:hypothetical protein
MSGQIDHWVSTLGESYAPTCAFELANGKLGLAWQTREKEVGGVAYTEFVLATVVEPSGGIQHYTTYAVPKNLVKRVEPYKWRRESALSDLFTRFKETFFGGRGDERESYAK